MYTPVRDTYSYGMRAARVDHLGNAVADAAAAFFGESDVGNTEDVVSMLFFPYTNGREMEGSIGGKLQSAVGKCKSDSSQKAQTGGIVAVDNMHGEVVEHNPAEEEAYGFSSPNGRRRDDNKGCLAKFVEGQLQSSVSSCASSAAAFPIAAPSALAVAAAPEGEVAFTNAETLHMQKTGSTGSLECEMPCRHSSLSSSSTFPLAVAPSPAELQTSLVNSQRYSLRLPAALSPPAGAGLQTSLVSPQRLSLRRSAVSDFVSFSKDSSATSLSALVGNHNVGGGGGGGGGEGRSCCSGDMTSCSRSLGGSGSAGNVGLTHGRQGPSRTDSCGIILTSGRSPRHRYSQTVGGPLQHGMYVSIKVSKFFFCVCVFFSYYYYY